MNEDFGKVTACYMLSYERRSKHSAERMWHAITDADEVGAWMSYQYPVKIDLRPGGEYRVDFSKTDPGEGLEGVIIKVDEEGFELVYAWGLSVVVWKITPDGESCSYTFIQNGLADRGEDEEGLAAGWHEFFDRLDEHLDGKYATQDEHKKRWIDLKPSYKELLDAAIPR